MLELVEVVEESITSCTIQPTLAAAVRSYKVAMAEFVSNWRCETVNYSRHSLNMYMVYVVFKYLYLQLTTPT